MNPLASDIQQLQRLPDTVAECHAIIQAQRAELRATRIRLGDALDAEARANARATDMTDRLAEFAWHERVAWIGLFSAQGIAKICKSAGMRVSKRGGALPSKGSMIGRLSERGDSRAAIAAIADLFDQFDPEDFDASQLADIRQDR